MENFKATTPPFQYRPKVTKDKRKKTPTFINMSDIYTPKEEQ